MVERLLDGENPVRVWREHRGLTVKALAERAGISAAYLSQIEGGQRDGSLDTMRKIAEACGEAGTPAHTPLLRRRESLYLRCRATDYGATGPRGIDRKSTRLNSSH